MAHKTLCTDLKLFRGIGFAPQVFVFYQYLGVPGWQLSEQRENLLRQKSKKILSTHTLNNTVPRCRDIQPQTKSQASVTEWRPAHLQGINSFFCIHCPRNSSQTLETQLDHLIALFSHSVPVKSSLEEPVCGFIASQIHLWDLK